MHIPFFSKREQAQPLRRALNRASYLSGFDRYTTTRIATYVFESIAEEVCLGHVVRIPGFGAFGPWLIETRSALARDPRKRCKPVFSPARGFQDQVRLAAPVSAAGKRKLTRHRRNHYLSSKDDSSVADVVTTMEAIRRSIDEQIGDSIDWPAPGEND